jgi:hypothetical protein
MADKPRKSRRSISELIDEKLANLVIDGGTYGDEPVVRPPLPQQQEEPQPGEIGRPTQYPPDQVISEMTERLKQGRIKKVDLFKEMRSWTKEKFGAPIGRTLFHKLW